jgi:hypothetical protein
VSVSIPWTSEQAAAAKALHCAVMAEHGVQQPAYAKAIGVKLATLISSLTPRGSGRIGGFPVARKVAALVGRDEADVAHVLLGWAPGARHRDLVCGKEDCEWLACAPPASEARPITPWWTHTCRGPDGRGCPHRDVAGPRRDVGVHRRWCKRCAAVATNRVDRIAVYCDHPLTASKAARERCARQGPDFLRPGEINERMKDQAERLSARKTPPEWEYARLWRDEDGQWRQVSQICAMSSRELHVRIEELNAFRRKPGKGLKPLTWLRVWEGGRSPRNWDELERVLDKLEGVLAELKKYPEFVPSWRERQNDMYATRDARIEAGEWGHWEHGPHSPEATLRISWGTIIANELDRTGAEDHAFICLWDGVLALHEARECGQNPHWVHYKCRREIFELLGLSWHEVGTATAEHIPPSVVLDAIDRALGRGDLPADKHAQLVKLRAGLIERGLKAEWHERGPGTPSRVDGLGADFHFAILHGGHVLGVPAAKHYSDVRLAGEWDIDPKTLRDRLRRLWAALPDERDKRVQALWWPRIRLLRAAPAPTGAGAQDG